MPQHLGLDHKSLCHHQVMLMVAGNDNAAVCQVLAALLHTTSVKDNDVISVQCLFVKATSLVILQLTSRNNF